MGWSKTITPMREWHEDIEDSVPVWNPASQPQFSLLLSTYCPR